MSVYDPLKRRLEAETGDKLTLSFAEIETILNRSLPESAYQYQAWWSNEDPDDTTHTQCRSWVLVRFEAEADLPTRIVCFRRMKSVR